MERIKGLNAKHRVLVRQHLKFLQSRVYKVTENDETLGKFLDFQNIIDTIVTYSNDFKEYTTKGRSREEWMYMIPSLSLYASLGFLAGMKSDKMEKFVDFELETEKFVDSTLNVIGILSDILQEQKELEALEEEVSIVSKKSKKRKEKC